MLFICRLPIQCKHIPSMMTGKGIYIYVEGIESEDLMAVSLGKV